jgi:cobalamin biosynthesis Mg chelatase CobN
VTGDEGAGTPLPAEVPREFADAYREAYEAALAAQAERQPGAHAQRSADRRWRAPFETGRGRPSSGNRSPGEQSSSETSSQGEQSLSRITSQAPPSSATWEGESVDVESGEPTAYERVRDSAWFVPALLVLLVVLMLIGAYVLGRLFATHVGA